VNVGGLAQDRGFVAAFVVVVVSRGGPAKARSDWRRVVLELKRLEGALDGLPRRDPPAFELPREPRARTPASPW